MFGTDERPGFAAGTVNLASARLGAKGVFSTDEFFAPLSRMLSDELPLWEATRYDDNGKYMDGWESRRKRVAGHDWAVVKLAMPGRIHGVDIDTHWFTGNYPPFGSVDAAFSPDGDPDPNDDAAWTEILANRRLAHPRIISSRMLTNPGSGRISACTSIRMAASRACASTALRISTGPRWPDQEIDLAYIFHGAKSLAWSDAHYGHPDKMLEPGRGENMGSGWETKRRRGPGHDWAIIRLGHPGTIKRIEVDTHFYKGNFPDTCELLGANLPGLGDTLSEAEIAASENWKPILGRKKLQADHIHHYGAGDIADIGPVTHVRYGMFPDGGTMRLRLFGVKG
jgi:allantoicase